MRAWLLWIAVLAGTLLMGQPPAAGPPYKVGGSVSPPRIISKVEPEYTQAALDARREGHVRMELVVMADGAPSDVHEISQPLGFGLDEKAIEAVQQWRFQPGEKSGQPVAVIIGIEMNFSLPR
jgi:protein TonB